MIYEVVYVIESVYEELTGMNEESDVIGINFDEDVKLIEDNEKKELDEGLFKTDVTGLDTDEISLMYDEEIADFNDVVAVDDKKENDNVI